MTIYEADHVHRIVEGRVDPNAANARYWFWPMP